MKDSIFKFEWFEDEPTGPNNGTIRYSVEADGPDEALDTESYFVNVQEENLNRGSRDMVMSRDTLLLNENDLDRMLRALTSAREAIDAHKRQVLAHKEKTNANKKNG